MSSAIGRTTTRIINAAKEPEIVDLANFINACGGRVRGAGSSTITVEGVRALSGCTYTPIPDRIITGSYLLAVAAAGGSVTLENARPQHNESLITKLIKSGCDIRCYDDKIHIASSGRKASITSIQTSPYPGFPTDLQSQISAYQSVCRGVSTVTENLFESRFKYVPELIKMGAKITVRDRTAIITGTEKLEGAIVNATDLRGGVALVIAALSAYGVTEINNADYIYRGHAAIEDDLAGVGANIIRVDD
jgi:UDP-N-acetylglucosamine 1-carboxyvinyltransferase